MRQSPGGPGPVRHILWRRLKVRLERLVEPRRPHGGAGGDADACAVAFVERLEDAVSHLHACRAGFDGATRQNHHVEALRRVLGGLLDVLADWEMRAGRGG